MSKKTYETEVWGYNKDGIWSKAIITQEYDDENLWKFHYVPPKENDANTNFLIESIKNMKDKE